MLLAFQAGLWKLFVWLTTDDNQKIYDFDCSRFCLYLKIWKEAGNQLNGVVSVDMDFVEIYNGNSRQRHLCIPSIIIILLSNCMRVCANVREYLLAYQFAGAGGIWIALVTKTVCRLLQIRSMLFSNGLNSMVKY